MTSARSFAVFAPKPARLALGLLALTAAVAAAAQAQSPHAAGLMARHVALCLSGAGEGAQVWAFAGHCAACWAALGLSALGAVSLISARQ